MPRLCPCRHNTLQVTVYTSTIVSGYAVGLQPPDFHGFFEFYVVSGWYLFDATRLGQRKGLIHIGTGRDAADASFARVIGAPTLVKINVHAVELAPDKNKQSANHSANHRTT